MSNTILNLPKNLICVIASKLDDKNLTNFLMTSFKCASLFESDVLWLLKFQQMGSGDLFEIKPPSGDIKSSKWYRIVSNSNVETLLTFSVKSGYLAVVDHILKKIKADSWHIDRLLSESSKAGQLAVVIYLLENFRNVDAPWIISNASRTAARAQHYDIALYLIELNNFHPDNLGDVLRMASAHGRYFMVLNLLKHENINPVSIDLALADSMDNDHIDIFKTLLSYKKYHATILGDMLEIASYRGYHDCVVLLLRVGNISHKDIQRAITQAEKRNDKNIVNLLLWYQSRYLYIPHLVGIVTDYLFKTH